MVSAPVKKSKNVNKKINIRSKKHGKKSKKQSIKHSKKIKVNKINSRKQNKKEFKKQSKKKTNNKILKYYGGSGPFGLSSDYIERSEDEINFFKHKKNLDETLKSVLISNDDELLKNSYELTKNIKSQIKQMYKIYTLYNTLRENTMRKSNSFNRAKNNTKKKIKLLYKDTSDKINKLKQKLYKELQTFSKEINKTKSEMTEDMGQNFDLLIKNKTKSKTKN